MAAQPFSHSMIFIIARPEKHGKLTAKKSTAMKTLHRSTRLSLAMALLAAAAFLPAQPPPSFSNFNPRFEIFDLPDNDNVQCIVQDSTGFVWFASQAGLYRYDGQHVVTYRNDPHDSTSIASDYLEWIFVDKNDLLWLGYPSHGMSAFDPATGRCRHFTHNPNDPQSLSSNMVWMIAGDREGFIWAATDNGLNRLDPKTGRFRRFFHDPGNPKSLSYNLVRSVYADRQGMVWAGCGVPWDENDPNGKLGGLNRYNGDGTFTRYLHVPANPNSLADNRVRALFEDSRGNFWVGTAGAGLHLMNRNAGTFTRLSFDPRHPSRLSSPVLQRSKPPLASNYHVSFISEDRGGRLWIGSSQGGLNIYDPRGFGAGSASQRMRHFEEAPGMTDSLQSKSVLTFCQTRDGVVWLGCGGDWWAVYQVKPEQNLFSFLDCRRLGWKRLQIHGMAADSAGGFWAQTTGDFNGVLHFDRDKNLLNRFEYEPLVEHTEFLDFFEIGNDPSGRLWASTEKGLYKLSGGKLRPDTTISKSITFPYLWPPYLDKKGNIWIPSFGDGVYRFDARWENSTHFKHDPKNPQSLGGDQVELVFEDSRGNLWVMGGGIGRDPEHPLFLDRFEPGTGTFAHFLQPGKDFGDPMRAVEDKQGNIWLTVFPYGIRKMNPQTGELQIFTHANGALPESKLTELCRDERGDIWLLGSGIVLRLNPETGQFFNFTAKHGLQLLSLGFISGSCTTTTGEIVFGGENGFFFFHPEEVFRRANRAPSLVRLTDFKVKGSPVVPGEGSPLRRPIWQTTEIRLRYDQNVFSFNLANFDFNGAVLNRLEFMLENYDRAWRSDLREGEAAYVNVPPGEYVFRVRGANSLGAWSKEGASLRIVISPPWWRTWWAWLGYAAIAFGGIFFLYKTQLERRLEHAETLRLQELDAVKTKLYTNITHEFRTPLTVILGMARQVQTEIGNWKLGNWEIGKSIANLDMVIRNGQNLLHLVNQMLDLSKLESGKLALHYEQSDVVVFLKYLVESFHSLAENKGVQVHFLADFQELKMDFDAERLQQVVTNLLSNAVKFTPAGGQVYVSVGMETPSLSRSGQSLSNLSLKIRDTGIGISEENLPHIFDRFYQVDGSHTRLGEGTGIGLALTKELVHLMDGDISVKSILCKGTAFVVTLPVRQLASMASAREVLPLPSPEILLKKTLPPLDTPQPSPDHPLLLLAEDNEDVVIYLASCLAADYRIAIAKNGQECIDMAQEIIPDLLVTDVMMPNKDGFEVCETLKNDERTSHIPIIMLTAKADMDSKMEGIERGADAFLVKPFHKEELLLHIKKLLESRRSLQHHYLSLVGLTTNEKPPAENLPKLNTLEDYFVKKVKKIVDAHLDDFCFTVETLCHEAGISHAQLHRKLIAITGISANKFIRSVRLSKAKELLNNPEATITSVAFDVGFNDPSYFSRVFKQEFGMTPMEWRERNGIAP